MSAAFQDHPNSEILVKLALSIPALFIAISSPIIGIVALLKKSGRASRKHLTCGWVPFSSYPLI